MWPWKKKKIYEEKTPEIFEKKENQFETIEIEDVASAIITLIKRGFHPGLIYAQMNGYDKKLNNPLRSSELEALVLQDPDFSDSGIQLAVENQIEELTFLAKNPSGIKFPTCLETKKLQKEEDDKKWARDILASLYQKGDNDLMNGLNLIGFDIKRFLVHYTVELRKMEIEKIYSVLSDKKNILQPLFMQAYNKGQNKYGEVQYHILYKEIKDFFDNFFPEGSLHIFYLAPPAEMVFDVALGWIEAAQSETQYPDEGIDFEYWCANEIKKQGWTATVSKASGDQGVDIVSVRDCITVVIQCKRYKMPIGNKAVQEAYTGKKYYDAKLAFVIGTGGFTRSAIELGKKTGVILLDANLIGSFSEQIYDNV